MDGEFFIVAEIRDDGRRLYTDEWSYEVFTQLKEAMDELALAHEGGLVDKRIFKLLSQPTLVTVPTGD